MPKRIIFGLHLYQDMAVISRHYQHEAPDLDLGVDFANECFDQFQFLAHHPRAGTRITTPFKALRNVRRWRLRRFKSYYIHYLEVGNALEILRILHASRSVTARDRLLLGDTDPAS